MFQQSIIEDIQRIHNHTECQGRTKGRNHERNYEEINNL